MAATTGVRRELDNALYRGGGVGWDEIVGLEHARREVAAVLALLKKRDLAKRVGAELTPMLFLGPAGVGKTLMAKAMSRDLQLPLYQWAASELDADLIEGVFDVVRTEHCVVFFDELDLIATSRSSESHSDRTKSALVQLCAELDGMDVVDGPLIVGATAVQSYFLDDSLLRSGRFSTKIEFSLPNRDERLQLLQLYADRLVLIEDLDLVEAAERSQGATGADIRAILNAGLALALADGREGLTRTHLFEALERRGHVRRLVETVPEVQWATAIHESGHAFAAFALFGAEALNRVTILPSADADSYSNGHFSLREEWKERHALNNTNWRDECVIGYAGMVAEQLVTGAFALGSGPDVAQVIGRIVSCLNLGADPDLGPVSPEQVEGHGAYGSEAMRNRVWSLVDRHGHEIFASTRQLLDPQRDAIERLAFVLRDALSLSGERLVAELRKAGAVEAAISAS